MSREKHSSDSWIQCKRASCEMGQHPHQLIKKTAGLSGYY